MASTDGGPASAGINPGFLALLRKGDVAQLMIRYSDVGLAGVVVLIVGMMIIPLPTLILDLFISLNISVAVVLLLISIYVSEPLRIATFPTILLLTTLFRLALEVSATRLILLKANAGGDFEGLGNFVVAGNLVVGAVIFFILTMIQFIVISKGSERVAEVGARFTLDAMPGKQMSIDAELRAGHIDHVEARRRRAMLARESQFFGAMDGAMKFVKGDSIAGIVVLLTNIVGGLIIGVAQRGMDIGQAAKTYTVLTIGEGLVSQIPALVISTAAGILVTRVASEEEGGHLGRDIGGQILAQPKALAIAAAMLVLLALVPGLPALPFLVLAILLGFVSYRLMKKPEAGSGPASPALPGKAAGSSTARSATEGMAFPAPLLMPIVVDMGAGLAAHVMADGDKSRFTTQITPALRERVFDELGIPLPAVRVRAPAPGIAANAYVIRLQEVAMATGETLPGGGLCFETEGRLAAQSLSGQPGHHPDGTPGIWLDTKNLAAATAAGISALSAEDVIASHVLVLLRRYGHEFVGIQETQQLLEGLERSHPALVREVVPKLVSPVLLADVLKRLAEEGVSLRALREILGALAEWAPIERDPIALTEMVRQALRRPISAKYAGSAGTLGVYLLDPLIEQTVREAIHKTPTGSYLGLEPQLSRDIITAVSRAIPSNVRSAVILTQADIRRFVRRLVESERPEVAVLSFQELAAEMQIQPIGRIRISET